jgi:ATP synthase F1 complex assembly factor 2
MLASAIAAEWDAQLDPKKGLQPTSMPLMSLVSTAIDQVQSIEDRKITIENCLKYLSTDSALFFTEETDRLLLKQQEKHYLPVLQWFNETFGIHLHTTDSMSGRIKHKQDAVLKIKKLLDMMVIFFFFFCVKWIFKVFIFF